MNIFVSGGAGYIGSATAEALLKAGHIVTVFDSLITGHRGAVPVGAHFIHAGLEDSHALAEALTSERFDAVMHFAAFIEAGESMKDPGRFFHNNFANSLNLIETATRSGVKRFVFSSTAAVYRSSDTPLTEESPLGPTNVYGQTKLMTEQALDWYRQIFGMHFAALRYFNACGALPGRGEAHRPESHLIPRVLDVALGQAESIKINGTD
jgi:UDP-glucose 4-epimerase